MRRGKTFIICGPSGVGKGTIAGKLLEMDPSLCFSVSATTRAPRPGERDGVHYHFLSREQFQRWIDEDAFLEHAQFVGNCYGTPARYVDQAMEEGRDVLLDIEVQGAAQVKAKRPETVRIYTSTATTDVRGLILGSLISPLIISASTRCTSPLILVFLILFLRIINPFQHPEERKRSSHMKHRTS